LRKKGRKKKGGKKREGKKKKVRYFGPLSQPCGVKKGEGGGRKIQSQGRERPRDPKRSKGGKKKSTACKGRP